MTTGSDEPEDERTHATGEDSPERGNRQNGEHPVDRRDQQNGGRGVETDREPAEAGGPETAAETDSSDAEREKWRFSVTDVSDPEEEDEEGNVAGILMRNEPLEPGSIDLENAFFFLLGSLGTIVFVVLAVTGL